jgi:hypothetical protein
VTTYADDPQAFSITVDTKSAERKQVKNSVTYLVDNKHERALLYPTPSTLRCSSWPGDKKTVGLRAGAQHPRGEAAVLPGGGSGARAGGDHEQAAQKARPLPPNELRDWILVGSSLLLTQYSTGTGSRERNLGLVVVAGPMTVLQVVNWRGVGHLFRRSPNHCA